MPDPVEILEGLTRIAHAWAPVAVAWHALALGALALAARGRMPRRAAAALALAALLASVSVAAWSFANPFNGTTFALGAALVAAFGARLGGGPVRWGPRWALTLGALSTAFGLVYPHFLADFPGWVYLVAAPVGLVPCPTLALATGLCLLGGGFGSRSVPAVLGGMGLFYALFGMLRLGVWLDAGLLVCAVAALICATRREGPGAATR